MATDAEIRARGINFLSPQRYLQNEFQLPTNTPVVEEETESFGIPQTQAFTNSGGNNYTGGFNNNSFQQAVDARQRNLNKPTDTSTFMGRTMGKVRDFIEPQSASQIMKSGYQEPRFQPGIIGMMMGKLDNYRNLPRADQAFISSQMGYTGPTIFGENNSGLGKDEFGINTRSAFGNYAEYVDKKGKSDMTDKEFADYVAGLKGMPKRIALTYRNKSQLRQNLQKESLAGQMERDREAGKAGKSDSQDQSRAGSLGRRPGSGGNVDRVTEGPGQNVSNVDNQAYDSGGREGYGYGLKEGGRAGYFFGGRARLRGGGMSQGNESNISQSTNMGGGATGDFSTQEQTDNNDRVTGRGYNSNNLSSTVDINKEINKKITGMIPDRVDKNQLLFDNAKRYQTLSRNKNSPFFMNRSNGPKTINKNLYTNNLADLNLQYPDIKIENEYGMIDGDRAKSLIDQAVLEQTISPVEGLNLTRSIDTTGTQSNTSGNYTMGNFNFNSPNIEQGILNSGANYNLGDLNLNANLNTNDSTINDSKLGFNYGNGALTGSTYKDNDYGYTTNKLGVDKKFNVGNNFSMGLDGNYENTIYNGENYRDSEFTPSLNYNDGTFNANLSKEIVEGGTQPSLGIGFQKNGFYASANNLLSQDPTGKIGYQKNIGSPDGPLQFSAGGEMDPFTGQKTAGLYGKYTFKNGGLASIL